MRGAFTAADAVAAGRTLSAYAFGLLPFVLIRSAVASFFARGDTATPVKAALIAAAVNIGFKVLLMGPLAQVGLALATSIGAWINLSLVLWFAHRAGHLAIDARLKASAVRLAAAGLVMAAVLWLGHAPVERLFAGWHRVARAGDAHRARGDRRRPLRRDRSGVFRANLAHKVSRHDRTLKRNFMALLPNRQGGLTCLSRLWGQAGPRLGPGHAAGFHERQTGHPINFVDAKSMRGRRCAGACDFGRKLRAGPVAEKGRRAAAAHRDRGQARAAHGVRFRRICRALRRGEFGRGARARVGLSRQRAFHGRADGQEGRPSVHHRQAAVPDTRSTRRAPIWRPPSRTSPMPSPT